MIKMSVFNLKKTQNSKIYYTPGNVRLGLGLYRTNTEQQKYLQKSLKRKLP